MSASYDYLYRIGTTGMTIVMGLLFGKVTETIFSVLSTPSFTWDFKITAISTLLTVLLHLIAIIGTISYAHNELKIPYRPSYFLISLLLVTLPLYFAVQAVDRAISANVPILQMDKAFFNYGMTALLLAFISLTIYLSIIYLYDNPKDDNQNKTISFGKFLSVFIFNIGGIIYVTFSMISTEALVLMTGSIMALLGTIIYLVFVWALQIKFSLN